MAVAEDGEYKLYRYTPSVAGAVIFMLLFAALSFLHLYHVIRTKTKFFIAFVVGGFFEFVGFAARIASAKEAPDFGVAAYAIQSLLILVAPALFAASIYMYLGRIILLTDGESHSLIRKRWLTKIFVAGDVLSFLMQGSGGGYQASGTLDALDTGANIIIGGLVIQIIFFGFFTFVAGFFHARMRAMPTARSQLPRNPWRRHLYALYGGSALILVRSLFRLIEYAQGNDGYLISTEWFLYVFDALLMLAVMILFAIIHPSEVQALLQETGGQMVTKGYAMITVTPLASYEQV